MSNIFEIIDSLGFPQEDSNKLQAYLVTRSEERTVLYSALNSSRKADEDRVCLLKEFLKNISAGNLTVESIEEIIKPYIRDPLPREPPNNIPDDVSDISTYLTFVNREEEIIKLMKNMDDLYRLVINPKAFSQPKKEIRFPTAVGTAGKGKTTFARVGFFKSCAMI
ncbi:hypothetical protein C1646_820477 [Rhizophagus diaphanus]|nr:hypothetical protein C1646_820477 [Rhizophagus diaphanus] [Rhizophagus sp. MUCL 43196]